MSWRYARGREKFEGTIQDAWIYFTLKWGSVVPIPLSASSSPHVSEWSISTFPFQQNKKPKKTVGQCLRKTLCLCLRCDASVAFVFGFEGLLRIGHHFLLTGIYIDRVECGRKCMFSLVGRYVIILQAITLGRGHRRYGRVGWWSCRCETLT